MNTSLALLLEIALKLQGVPCYTDTCSYEVLLASMSEPVAYSVELRSSLPAKPDTLAPCHYLISWKLPAPSGLSEGFSAYFDGHHYRFRDTRLQEYHHEWDAAPFAPSGRVTGGVQWQVQFGELLPQFIGRRFEDMASDSTYIYKVVPDTLVSGRRSTVVEGRRRINGYDAAEFTYVLDAKTLLPRSIELENNPGQLGEQSIVVTYGGHAKPGKTPCPLSQDELVELKSEAFENFRESTFSLENMPGKPLPEITAPTTTGERYLHAKGDPFAAPTLLVFVESGVGSTPDVVKAVRSAVDTLPMQLDVVWAFLDHRADDVEAVLLRPRPGEHLLFNAAGAARDCGVGTNTPAIILADASGVVRDFIIGYNQDLESVVIQKAGLYGRQ